LEHKKSDESPILLRELFGRGLVSGHVAQHAGELVREQERQHGHISDWRERKQGREDWTVASEVRGPGQYMPVHPDVFAEKWDLQFSVTPVIPKLIKRNLFDF
jgi:hypothetical protein